MSSVSTALTAVILAAGMGSRLRSVHADKPKGFVEIGDGPIIARSLALLLAAGIRDIVLVAGWRSDVYRDFLTSVYPSVRVAINGDYSTTGSLASLIIGSREVTGDAIIVESDLLYETRAMATLLAAPSPNTLLASGPTGSRDEVWVYGNEDRLAHLSKGPWTGAPCLGELVGLTRLSGETLRALIDAAASLPATAHYEDGLNVLCSQCPIEVLRIDDLAWCEIDDRDHLNRARELIWPRILASERGGLTTASR